MLDTRVFGAMYSYCRIAEDAAIDLGAIAVRPPMTGRAYHVLDPLALEAVAWKLK